MSRYLKAVTALALVGYGIAFYIWWELDQMIKGKWRG